MNERDGGPPPARRRPRFVASLASRLHREGVHAEDSRPAATPNVATFTVAFVCSGNRARSPLAEALFRRRTEAYQVDVISYGTLRIGEREPLRGVLELAPSLGLDLRAHRSRALLDRVLEDTDLVVGFEPQHLRQAVELGAASPDRTFMLLELPALLQRLDPGRTQALAATSADLARETVAALSRQRGPIGALPARPLADPFGEPPHVLAEVARTIDVVTALLAEELFPFTPDDVGVVQDLGHVQHEPPRNDPRRA